MNVKDVNRTLFKAAASYYEGEPIMADAEFDLLEKRLKDWMEDHPEDSLTATYLHTVGHSSPGSIPHLRPMLSIENTYTEDAFISAAIPYGAFVRVEPKWDGVSAELCYEDGVLVQAVTRGDGQNGESFLSQARVLKSIPKRVNDTRALRIRGELVMTNAELARINQEENKNYATSRNLVAGTIKQKNLNTVRYRDILFLPWDIYLVVDGIPQDFDTFTDMDKILGNLGMAYGGVQIPNHPDNIMKAMEIVWAIPEKHDIDCDGIVIKAEPSMRQTLGVGKKYTNYQHCFKNQSQRGTTKIAKIEYCVGRTGVITPVAILEPVVLGGVQVIRASLMNESWIKAKGITVGCTVEVIRSGDVIPYINRVVSALDDTAPEEFSFPATCPCCNTVLVKDDSCYSMQYYCMNTNCRDRVMASLCHSCGRDYLDVNGMGPEMARFFYHAGVRDLADLVRYCVECNLSPKELSRLPAIPGGVNARKVIDNVRTTLNLPWDKWISAFGIPMIGKTLASTIVRICHLTSESMNDLSDIISKAEGLSQLGPVRYQELVKWSQSHRDFCQKLYKYGVRPASPIKTTGKLSGKVICITGTFESSRTQLAKLLESHGAEVVSTVNAKCNLLLCGEDAGSKLDKAKAKGIDIVDDSWFNSL